jgi:glycosyltransferase involved in cell wall biosynthesis
MPELWLLDDARIIGGGQLFTIRLARYALAQRGAQQARIVCPSDSELGRRAEAFGIPVYGFGFPAPSALPLVAARGLRLRRMLRRRDAIVVAGSARCQAVAVAAGLGPRLVHLMHEQESASRPSVRFVQRRMGRVVAVGATTAHAYGSPGLRNFLLEEDFARLAMVTAAPGDGTLGVLARLIPEKGVLELIAELDGLPGWTKLLVAGPAQDADYAGRVRAAAGEQIELLGEIADAAGLLARVDALVVPSVGHEAQPTAILEALAAGRPVIVRAPIHSSDYAGLPVFPYGDLGAAIAAARAAAPPNRALVRERFGAAQALAVIEGRTA